MARRRIPRALASSVDSYILDPGEIVYEQTNDTTRLGDGNVEGGKTLLTQEERTTFISDRPYYAADGSVIVSPLATARATGKMIRGYGSYNFGEGLKQYYDVRWRTVPAGEAVDNTFGERLIIDNPINNMTGYAARRVDYTSSGVVDNGRNTIGSTLLLRMSDMRNGFSWNNWEVCMSPLNPASGLPGAPGGAQQFSMLIGEWNPTNRHGDGGWRGETRHFTPCGVGGVQVVPETQDFTSLLGGQRIGYNIAFGLAFIKSPYAATNTGRHAQSYNHLLVNPNSIAPGGYFAFATGYYDFATAVAVSAPGSGYVVGDIVEFNTGLDGAANENTRVEVLSVNGSGGITSVRILISGWYQQNFATTVPAIYGSGTGATFTYTLSTVAERPASMHGIAGQWLYALDAAPAPNAESNHGTAVFDGALLRVPANSRIVHARNVAGDANLEALGMVGDVVLLGGTTSGVQLGTGATVSCPGPLVNGGITSLNFADDAAAAAGGVDVGGFYHNAGAVRVRLT